MKVRPISGRSTEYYTSIYSIQPGVHACILLCMHCVWATWTVMFMFMCYIHTPHSITFLTFRNASNTFSYAVIIVVMVNTALVSIWLAHSLWTPSLSQPSVASQTLFPLTIIVHTRAGEGREKEKRAGGEGSGENRQVSGSTGRLWLVERGTW